jgi:hypothetical protein
MDILHSEHVMDDSGEDGQDDTEMMTDDDEEEESEYKIEIDRERREERGER